MSITKDCPVPTNYKKLRAIKPLFNVHANLLFVWTLLIIIYLGLVYISYNLGFSNQTYYMAILVPIALFAFKYARDEYTLNKTYLHIILILRILFKNNIIKKYNIPLDDLKKIFNIDTIEDSGLIIHLDHTSSIIIRLDPPKITDDEMEDYSKKMKQLINTLYGNYSFHFITMTLPEINNHLTNQLIETLKKTDITSKIITHLQSLYDESIDKKEEIKLTYLLSVSFPKFESITESEKRKDSFLSGLSKQLNKIDIYHRVIDNRNETIQILRECIC